MDLVQLKQELSKEDLSDKIEILDGLTSSVNEEKKRIKQCWDEEVIKRSEAVKNGQLKTISIDEIFS
ncbi:MAG: hypothetical protein GW809_04240 [Bacteroidetes bacterium]|nr:hypothetical protein [Bacteroidota bacterium]